MLSVNMKMLDNYAGKMVKECRDNVGNAGETAKSFFKYANKNDAHCQALIAYYSQINKSSSVGVEQVFEAVDIAAKKNNFFKKHLALFARKLDQKYPETLEKRLAIVAHGGVVPDRVQPKSKFRKIIVLAEIKYQKMKHKIFDWINKN